MSSIYIQEPPTEGKVLLKTTFGEIDIELWSREAPKACRNFVQLCMEGFYNDVIFHRVVRNFIAQTGDPAGTGCTCVSIYGAPFKDEIHSRLRFARRGLVALANNGKDDNGCQFFFTLDATPELQGKHTIFGKVVGDTLYNLIKLNELIVDEDDRPVYVQKIIKSKVLSNPFPDIIPRVTSSSKESKSSKNDEKKKTKESGVKNFKLLSFGDEAEEDEIETSMEQTKYVGKSKSTHDVLNDPMLSSKTINDDDSVRGEEKTEDLVDQAKEKLNALKTKLSSKKDERKEPTSKRKDEEKPEKTEPEDDDLGDDDYFERQREAEKNEKLEKIRREIKDFKRENRKEENAKNIKKEDEKKEEVEKSEVLKEFEESRKKFVETKQTINLKGESREQFTLEFLAKFGNKLQKRHAEDSAESEESSKKHKKSKHKDKSSKDPNSDEECNSDRWFRGPFKVSETDDVLAKDANTKSDDWYDIYDPRNPLNKRRRETHKHSSKKSKRSRYDD